MSTTVAANVLAFRRRHVAQREVCLVCGETEGHSRDEHEAHEDREREKREAEQRIVDGVVTGIAARLTASVAATSMGGSDQDAPRLQEHVGYRDVMTAVPCSKSAAYRHLREAVGRPVGTRKALRASVEQWERYARRTFGR